MPARCSPTSDWSSTPKPSPAAPSATRKLRARAIALLAHAVQNQAYVLAYIDGFMVLGFAVIGALLLMLLLRDPPGASRAAGGAEVIASRMPRRARQ